MNHFYLLLGTKTINVMLFVLLLGSTYGNECTLPYTAVDPFRLPSSFDSCPSYMSVSKWNCAAAALSVGGKLLDGKVVDGYWSPWSHVPNGCSIQHGNGSGIIHFNTHGNPDNDGGYEPVCSVENVRLPSSFDSCPPYIMSVSKEDCAAAGLSVGGKLRDGKLIDGSWGWVPNGCSIQHVNGKNFIHFNTHGNPDNDGGYEPVCRAENFRLPSYFDSCPLFMSVMSKEDCVAAGLSVGGKLRDGKLVDGSWSHVPKRCSIQHVNGKNLIHFNTHGNPDNDGGYEPVCSAENFRLPSYLDSCPSYMSVGKEDCAAAALSIAVCRPKHCDEGLRYDDDNDLCIHDCTALADKLSPEFSSEEIKSSYTRGPISKVSCYGPNCANKKLTYKKLAEIDVNEENRSWTSLFSDQNDNKRICPKGNFVVQVKCEGTYCSSMRLHCMPFASDGFFRFISDTEYDFTTDTFSEESRNYGDCGSDGAVVGVECTGRYCDNLRLYCKKWGRPHLFQEPGCKCVDHYVSQATGDQAIKDYDDECISSLISTYIPVTSTTITVKSKIISKMNDLVVTQNASPNDITLVLDERFSTKTILENNYEHTFSDLEPGHRYNIRFTYTDTDRTEIDSSFSAVTSCSCTNSGDKTGSPKSFKTTQESGHVMFSFIDNSYCEEAYSFTRRSYSDAEAVSFTRDYFFIPKVSCESKIEPLTEASDNLVKSKLVVGENYEYCVRAIHPVLYMDHPFDFHDEGRTLLSSNDTCVDHAIQWEASIHGKITTELNAGRLPIKDVAVSYQLLNNFDMSPIAGCDGCSGTVLTKEGGSFDIAFNLDHDVFQGKNDVEFPVKLRFSKETLGSNNDIIQHKFLCNGGEDDCSDDIGTIMYLSHLQFKEPIQVYDDTSVPFSGKVFVENTRYSGSSGCPISNVEVCLIQERNAGIAKTNETLVCGNTEPDGSYSLPVIIGSQVHYVELVYNGHSFEPSADSSFTPGVGVTIEAGKYYGDNDFTDVEKARLMVDVVGGLCDEFLGTSTVQAKIVGCEWEGTTYTQSDARGIYNNIPAHLLDVQVIDIKDTSSEPHKRYDHIWEYFQGDQPLVRTIDLRSTSTADEMLKDEEDSLEETNTTKGLGDQDKVKKDEANNVLALEKEEEEKLELVRFQFDGELKMSVHISGDSLSCGNYSVDDTDSFHVLEYMKSFTSTVELKYELIKEKDLYCDVVDSEKMKLHVVNQVGIDENEGFDEFLSKLPETTKELLELCKEGCLQDIVHDEDNDGKRSNAHVANIFATGRPNIAHPYTKRMIFSVQGSASDVTHTASTIVEGYYSKGPGRSFALPTHKPIMILRDPPGGLSYASYENIETIFKLETSSTTTSMHNKFGVGIKMVVEKDPLMCLGAGGGLAGPLFATCKKVASLDNETPLVDIGTQFGGLVQMYNKERSNEYSTTWSYQTSSDPWTAGSMSDTFVVPNLNVMYEEVYVVEWNNSTCGVTEEGQDRTLPQKTTFDIKSPENEPALAFFSRYHIQHVKIPELNRAKQNLQAELHDCIQDCDAKQIQLKVLDEGIDGWNIALREEDQTRMNLDPSKSINNWFSPENKHLQKSEVSPSVQNSGLSPKTLLRNEEILNNEIISLDDGSDEPIKRLQFSGGGNLFSMTLHEQRVLSNVGLSCWYGCNNEFDTSIKVEPSLATKAFGIGIAAHFTIIDLNIHVNHMSTLKESNNEVTSIGFTLGDDDPQDEFVVDLYYDDKFGTIIFDTAAGQSKCPHESGTAAIEDPSFEISAYPPQYVFPDEDMVFEIEMRNVGVGDESQFVFYAQHRDNSESLGLFLDGAPFPGSREFTNILKDTAYKKTLVVRRGPQSYEYPSLDLILESACEDENSRINDLTASIFDETKSVTRTLYNVLKDDGSKLIKYVEPCPKVEWAGELKRDRSFLVNTLSHDTENLQISVFNPNHGIKSFQQMVEQNRLQKVLLYYRELGQLHWAVARTEIEKESGELSSEETDFAATYADETSYGYIKMKWALANILSEGVYEIKVETQCDPLGGPDDIDMFSTTSLSGTIDLTPPEQYGQALPFKKSVLIGEEIVVVFSEPILCEKPFTFDLQVKIEGTDYIFDKEELQVVCEGRKIGFQIDPTVGIDVESVLGKSFSVEIGKVGADSLSNIFDINGNPIDDNIRVEKSFADIDLNQASTYFTFTKSEVECSNFTDSEMKTEVMDLLALDASDEERIQVGPVKCIGDNAVESKITIVPPAGKRRGLRLFSSEYSISQHEQNNSVKLFETLRDISTQNEPKHMERHLLAKHDHYLSFSVSNMKILPSSSDIEKMMKTIDPDLVDEEKELYHIATHAHVLTEQKTEVTMKDTDRKKIVNEIEEAANEREARILEAANEREAQILEAANEREARILEAAREREEKMSNELKTMTMELLVVTVACISVSLVTLFHVYRK